MKSLFLLFSLFAFAFGQVPPSIAGGPTMSSPADVTSGIVADWDFSEASSPVNVLQYSQLFTKSPWAVSALTVAATSAVTDPSGINRAYIITEGTGFVDPLLYQNTSAGTGSYTGSVYMKAGTRTWASLRFTSSNLFAWFNLSAGTVGTVQAGLTASITSAGNGWYQLSVSTATLAPSYFVIEMDSADNVHGVNGNGSTEYVWGAQVNAGSLVPYVATDFLKDSYGNYIDFTTTGTRATYNPYLAMNANGQLGVTSLSPPTAAFSVVALINTASSGAHSQWIFGANVVNALQVYIDSGSGGKLGVCRGSGGCVLSTGLFVGAPTVAAITFDGSTIKIYKNGLLDSSQAAAWTFSSNATTISTTGSYWSGTQYRLRFYNRALTSVESYRVSNWMRGLYNHYTTPVTFSVEAKAPLPLAKQVFLARQFGVSFCYNMSTFQGVEFATPNQNVNNFAPTGLNIDQWLDTAVAGGATFAILTVKHLDGFSLYPTAYNVPTFSPYSVAQTSWYAANGSPDIVQLFITKCIAHGLRPGLYFSIQDRTYEIRTNTNASTGTAAYIAMIETQLSELLTNYGNLDVLIVDSWGNTAAVGTPGSDGVGGYTYIPFATINNYVHSIQPNIIMMDDASNLGDFQLTEGVAVFPSGSPSVPYGTIWDYVQNWFITPASSIQSSSSMSTRLKFAIDHGWNYLQNLSVSTSGIIPSDQATAFSGITHN